MALSLRLGGSAVEVTRYHLSHSQSGEESGQAPAGRGGQNRAGDLWVTEEERGQSLGWGAEGGQQLSQSRVGETGARCGSQNSGPRTAGAAARGVSSSPGGGGGALIPGVWPRRDHQCRGQPEPPLPGALGTSRTASMGVGDADMACVPGKLVPGPEAQGHHRGPLQTASVSRRAQLGPGVSHAFVK